MKITVWLERVQYIRGFLLPVPALGVHLLDCLPGGGHIRVEMVPEVPGATLPPSASQGWSHANHNVTAAHGGLVCKKAPSLRSQHLPPVSAVAPLGSE